MYIFVNENLIFGTLACLKECPLGHKALLPIVHNETGTILCLRPLGNKKLLLYTMIKRGTACIACKET